MQNGGEGGKKKVKNVLIGKDWSEEARRLWVDDSG